MDASSVLTSNNSADLATNLRPLSSFSLPTTNQNFPLFNNFNTLNNNNNEIINNNMINNHQNNSHRPFAYKNTENFFSNGSSSTSSKSKVTTSSQSLKSDDNLDSNLNKENNVSSSRSTSSPQLINVRSRSKAYRRASLKSLTSIGSGSSLLQQPVSSRIIRLTNRGKVSNSQTTCRSLDLVVSLGKKQNLNEENVSSYQAFTNELNRSVTQEHHEVKKIEQQQQTNKSKSCSSFLPILSLIPNTFVSFQYPSPKMKFSWWRNKIS